MVEYESIFVVVQKSFSCELKGYNYNNTETVLVFVKLNIHWLHMTLLAEKDKGLELAMVTIFEI